MKKLWVFLGTAILLVTALAACSFSEYVQSANVTENIDDYRTGCEIDVDSLITEYKQYDANEYYRPGSGDIPRPTPTPAPIRDTEIATAALLEKTWEHGCHTGRRDAVGAEQATLMSLRDQFRLLEERITALEPTATPAPTN